MRGRLTSLATASLTVCLLLSSRAAAQAWLSDRGNAEGAGIRAGNLEIHPGVSAEVGYDSNVFLRDGTDNSVGALTDDLPEGSAVLRVTPHLFVSTLGAQRTEDDGGGETPPTVAFRGGLSLPVYHYFGAGPGDNAEANVDLGLKLLPKRVVSFNAMGRYRRAIRPFTSGPSGISYGRNNIDVSPQIRFQTTGGVLQVGVGGNFNSTFFDASEFAGFNAEAYRADLNASWTFLPKTALVYDAEVEYRDMRSGSASTAPGAGPLRVDSNRYQFRVGLNGSLTARLSTSLMLGYTAMFFQAAGGAGADTDNLSVLGAVKWQVSDTARAAIQYDRTTTAAYQGNFQLTDRVTLSGDVLAAGALLVGASASAARVAYGLDAGLNAPGDSKARNDLRLGVDLNAEYRFASWIALTTNVSLLTNMSDFDQVIAGTPPAVSIVDPANFTRFDAFLGMRIFY